MIVSSRFIPVWWNMTGIWRNMMGIWREYDGNMTGIWREYDGNMMGIWREYDGNMTGIWWEYDGNMTGIWREYDGNMREYDGNMTGIWWEYDGNMMGIWNIPSELWNYGGFHIWLGSLEWWLVLRNDGYGWFIYGLWWLLNGFPQMGMQYPTRDGLYWKTSLKWMMTGGTPISGNPHI